MAKYRHRARRERITFQAPVSEKTEYGHDKIVAYSNIDDMTGIHASFEHIGGTETFRGRQVEAGVYGVFEIRYPRRDVRPTWRVLHVNDHDKPYEIVSARPAEHQYEGGNRFMWVFVKAVA